MLFTWKLHNSVDDLIRESYAPEPSPYLYGNQVFMLPIKDVI